MMQHMSGSRTSEIIDLLWQTGKWIERRKISETGCWSAITLSVNRLDAVGLSLQGDLDNPTGSPY